MSDAYDPAHPFPSREERRRHKRLDQVFPVEFRLLTADGAPLGEWRQAFTQDVGQGGLCLIANQLRDEDVARLKDHATLVGIEIHIPLKAPSVSALGRPTWVRCLKEGLINQYGFGIVYQNIEERERGRIMRYVAARTFVKALAVTFWLMLSLGLVIVGSMNLKLRLENERLVKNFSDNALRQKTLFSDRAALEAKIADMEFLLQQADRKINTLTWGYAHLTEEERQQLGAMQSSVDFYKKYQDQLRREVEDLRSKRVAVVRETQAARQEQAFLEKKVEDKLYRWLCVHQNGLTGLVTSFEGDDDVKDWSFTYDQALAAIVFTYHGEPDRAKKIFDFYRRAEKIDGGAFVNAYYASTGEPAEFVGHVGPNVWLGLAVLQYTQKTGDGQYLGIARDIERWLASVRDAEGGLRGAKTVAWYSTEHNLDAYAFYKMLFALTRDDRDNLRAQETLAWLNKNAYSRLSDPLVKRGKGDATVATDTYAWSVAAVGPERLKAAGMDPEQIMEFAISHCAVCVTYLKPEGTNVRVKGFDFAKAQNSARGGVVSCEWTAQMALSLKIMADYEARAGDSVKAGQYALMAREYISEMSKMMVTSPSAVGQGEFCLPYASQEMADTGHGWRTPRGTRTGSVAGTAYTILAIDGVNPLSLEKDDKKTHDAASPKAG